MAGLDTADHMGIDTMLFADLGHSLNFSRALNDDAEPDSHVEHFIHLGVGYLTQILNEFKYFGNRR